MIYVATWHVLTATHYAMVYVIVSTPKPGWYVLVLMTCVHCTPYSPAWGVLKALHLEIVH